MSLTSENSARLRAQYRQTGLVAAVWRDAQRLQRATASWPRAVGRILFGRGFKALLLYRISHSLWRLRVPLIPHVFGRIAQFLYSVDIDYRAKLGPGITITHCFGLVIGCDVVIEGDCDLLHGVTLGTRGSEWVGDWITDGQPWIEEDCVIGAGAKILGPLRVGRNTVIGANAVVTRDVPPNSVMAGVPARRISERAVMDKQMRAVNGPRRTSR